MFHFTSGESNSLAKKELGSYFTFSYVNNKHDHVCQNERVASDFTPTRPPPKKKLLDNGSRRGRLSKRGIPADVIVYIFAHLHRALRTEGNILDIKQLQAAKELVEFNTW